MKKMAFCFLMCLMVMPLGAQTSPPSGPPVINNSSPDLQPVTYEGRFKAQEGDSAELIKGVLIREALYQVLLNKLKEENLNLDLFKKKWEEKIQKALSSQKNTKETNPLNERQHYLETIINVGKIQNILPSYLVLAEGVDAKNPNERWIKITALKF